MNLSFSSLLRESLFVNNRNFLNGSKNYGTQGQTVLLSINVLLE